MISIKEEPEMLESDLVADPTVRSGVRRGQVLWQWVDVYETLEMTGQQSATRVRQLNDGQTILRPVMLSLVHYATVH